ncbi:MAG: glycoside hydrolase family 97 protein [Verrucomicrobia bacterium]|nr:glycoside hydrolase family 97 protein [Verrucomicrobiota bacterium]
MTTQSLLVSACSVLNLLAPLAGAAQASHQLRSPDGGIVMAIRLDERICYDVTVDNSPVLRNSTLSLTIDATTLGLAPKLKSATPGSHDGILKPVVRQKAAELRDHYNELRLDMDGGYAVVFRAYNEGVAYRWETALPAAEVKVSAEEVALNFADNFITYYPEEESFYSHNERAYLPRALRDLETRHLASLPAIVDAKGVKIAVAESDVLDYPGLWLRGTGTSGLAGAFPPYPLAEQLAGDRDVKVTKTADYIAMTQGSRTYPWRLLGVARKDGDLITNPLVYLLARPTDLTDTTWIKPGKVAWDWWNANNLGGVDFKAGVNTETYKYYIDFAAQHGIEYVVLDEGWYVLGDLLKVSPGMDMEEIIAYGNKHNVGIILWAVWKTLDNQLEPALDRFERWGIKGIKVDFMQRDDQPLMNFYHRVSAEAAKRKMLVDFHGALRPALLTRTWPNLISTEGVRGLEWNKWSDDITPEHTVTLPFTRMFLGPMDFTPGAMLNATRAGFTKNFLRPMSMSTRCHQLAMYVVYESPLQMLADSPTNYLREPACMEFLSAVPSVWDDTRVLDARIADYIVVARRSGADWYCGAMTDSTPRDLTADLSFLPAGNFRMDIYQDGVNADRRADDFKQTTRTVSNATKLAIKLAEGGGWAARLRPE